MFVSIDFSQFDQRTRRELERLLAEPKEERSDLEQMWHLMDMIWDEYGCDNTVLDWKKIGQFYSHPVWLLNGFFTQQHELSLQHRNAISDWIVTHQQLSVVDYGGGYGSLAKLIAQKNNKISIEIFDPHPSFYGLRDIQDYKNIHYVDRLSKYDCLISTDVLEHVVDPLKSFHEMITSVNTGGYLIIANNFTPVIKCHLPHTFHLKYTFNFFGKLMGLKKIGIIDRSHATLFKKYKKVSINWPLIRFYENISKALYPALNRVKPVLRPVKNLLKR